MQSIHAHEVIKLILALEEPCTTTRLEDMVRERFGVDATFHACSRSGMKLPDLVEFLIQKGKAVNAEGGLGIVRDRVCRDL